MLRRQRLAVHLVGEQDVRHQRVVEAEASLVGLLLAALDPAVEAGEGDLHGGLPQPGVLEQRHQRRPAPAGRADRLVEPRLADGPGGQQRAAVAGALERHRALDGRPRSKLVERELERPLDRAADVEPPGVRVDDRNVVVDQQVVQPDRRDRIVERLERHAVVARRELQLLERDLGCLGQGHDSRRYPTSWH